jgi:hypothetical protein
VLSIDYSEKETRTDTKEKDIGEETFFVRRAKATVIVLFIFLCNRKIARKKIPFDGAGLTARECNVT